MMRLLRPPHSGIFLRSFRLHSPHYARETIAKICSLWVALATAIISQTGSWARLFGQHEGHFQPHAILGDLALGDDHVLACHPGARDVLQSLGGALPAILEGAVETLLGRSDDFRDPCD